MRPPLASCSLKNRPQHTTSLGAVLCVLEARYRHNMYLLSDSIQDADRRNYGEMAIKILDLLVLWDCLLDNMRWVAGDWRRADATHKKILGATPLRKRREIDLLRIVLDIASRERVSGDRSNVFATFERLQATRHHIAHASAMNAMTANGQPRIGIPYYAGNKRVETLDGGESTISTSLVTKRVADAQWLLEHVDWLRHQLGQSGGPLALDLALETPPSATVQGR
jgi:hypothetical protein